MCIIKQYLLSRKQDKIEKEKRYGEVARILVGHALGRFNTTIKALEEQNERQ